jgi:hypothetical protein
MSTVINYYYHKYYIYVYIESVKVLRTTRTVMSKAPRIKPANTKSRDGDLITYTYYQEGKLKDGTIVYHKHTNVRTVQTSDQKRKPRKTADTPLTDRQTILAKKKLLRAMRKQILENDDYSLEHIRKLKDMTGVLVRAF